MKLNLQPLFEKIEKLTRLHKILICVGTAIILIGPFVYFSFLPKHKEIDRLSNELSKLEQELVIAKRKASKLKEVEREMAAAQAEFDEAKRALPESEEIPTLLTSISHAGQDAGLEFLLFQPRPEKAKGFYAEIPVSMRVLGTYHQVVDFFYKVSRLNRIVNIKDIRVEAGRNKEKQDQLTISCTAVTYKFMETEPNPAQGK